MNEFLKIIIVILVSSVKFLAGPPFAYYDRQNNFTFSETIVYCIVGGMLGVVAFTYFSPPILRVWHIIKEWVLDLFFGKDKLFSKPVAVADSKLPVQYRYLRTHTRRGRRLFTKRNRRIVHIWKTYGLVGIAFLTPIILSIPIGTVVANSLAHNKRRIFIYMLISITFWSVALTSIFKIYDVVSLRELQEHVIQ